MPVTVKITWQGPDMAGGAPARIIKAALDAALLNHRRQFLPRHFTPDAIQRYGQPYAAACPNRSAAVQAGAAARSDIARRMRQMTPEQRRAERERLRRRAAELRASDRRARRDPKNLVPLVDTGRLKDVVLHGAAEFLGSVASRRMRLNPPYYTYLNTRNRLGVFDKVAAIKAVVPEESEEFARIVDQHIQAWFDQRL